MTTKSSSGDSQGRFGKNAPIVVLCKMLVSVTWKGISSSRRSSIFIWAMSCLALSGYLAPRDYHLSFLDWAFGSSLFLPLWDWIHDLGFVLNTALIFFPLAWAGFFGYGAVKTLYLKRFQRAIDIAGPKGAQGVSLRVVDVVKDGVHSIMRVSAPGVGPGRWEKHKEDLSFQLRQEITKIGTSADRKFIEVHLISNELPKKVDYFDCVEALTTPYSFIVGMSNSGIITQSIRDLPHMIMGGATGMGKSTAFKLILYSLLRSSPLGRLRMVLLDLKNGVEVTDFQEFPQVTIARDEAQAVRCLEEVVQEMKSRYQYFQESKNKKIDPERDELPIIVVGVDEASALYGAPKAHSSKKELINKARDLTSEIAKQGRACGIHLILATQRATKNSIDMATQDNLEGRLCFRTKSVSGSTAVLGDSSAMKLPGIPGRALWSKGAKVTEVQVPFLSEDTLSEECDALSQKFQQETEAKKTVPSIQEKTELLEKKASKENDEPS